MASQHLVTEGADGTLLLTGRCPITQKEWVLRVQAAAYKRWKAGALCQEAFPNLTADERELLISGTTKEGWDSMFADMDDIHGDDATL
jgi:hypothetical protein